MSTSTSSESKPNAPNVGNPFATEKPAPLLNHPAMVDLLCADAAERHGAVEAGRPLGPQTGIRELDGIPGKPGYLGGRLEVGVHVVLGGAGTGKTALCLQMGMDSLVPTLFVSGEITAPEVTRRIIANRTSTFLGRLKSGEFTADAVRDMAEEALAEVPLLGVVDATKQPLPLDTITVYLNTLKRLPGVAKLRGAPGEMIVIDSLNSWGSRAYPDLDEYQMLGRAFADLEKTAHSLQVPVVLIVEQNLSSLRESGKTGESAGLHSGAGHRRIAYAPETFMVLHRDKSAQEDMNGWVPVKLTLEKNRHGPVGKTVELKWSGARQRFQGAVL